MACWTEVHAACLNLSIRKSSGARCRYLGRALPSPVELSQPWFSSLLALRKVASTIRVTSPLNA